MRKTIVGIGELLWDMLPNGPQLGGAPANFACHAAELGKELLAVHLISAVGPDELGQCALEVLRTRGVLTDCVALSNRPTGEVRVTTDDAGHGNYRFVDDVAWDRLSWDTRLQQLASVADAVCFGTLAQRTTASAETIQRFVRSTTEKCLRVFDLNIRKPYFNDRTAIKSLRLANVVKINDDELCEIKRLLGIDGSERVLLAKILERFSLKLIALSRGAAGAILLNDCREYAEHRPPEIVIADTIGAGDSHTAVLVIGLLFDLPLSKINIWANQVAAYVASKVGATPSLPPEVRQGLQDAIRNASH